LTKFFPALAHTDSIGYLDENGNRKLMSITPLLPKNIASNFLVSLSFDESIHYSKINNIGDPCADIKLEHRKIETIFVDCGAFHYVGEKSPRFKKGGFVNSKTAFEEYSRRHFSKNPEINYLLCSPDHIITENQQMKDIRKIISENDENFDETNLNYYNDMLESQELDIKRRIHFILSSAKGFLKQVEGIENVTPVAVVHGRDKDERAKMATELIEIGYKYLAFGGLVPLARNQKEVLQQIAGINDLDNPRIESDSALAIAKRYGCKIHIFGLNSPEWYRWWKRLEIDSFDGSKLSQEGAANGIIWVTDFSEKKPKSAKELYRRLSIKKIKARSWEKNNSTLCRLIVSSDGELKLQHKGWKYLQSARCTSPKCPHRKNSHSCDPRVTGSIEHNMGRMIINSYAFEEIMSHIDMLYEMANNINDFEGREWLKNWKRIEVEL
jgi:hypothetical protein